MNKSNCSANMQDFEVTIHLLNELGGGTSKNRDYLANLISWLSVTPRFTIYRVNTLLYQSKVVQDIISSELSVQANVRGAQIPPVFIHPTMPEVVIMDSWNLNSLNLNYQQKEVVVDTACGMAVLRGAHVFAPGVKGMCSDIGPGDYVSVYADIENKCTRGLQCSFKERKYFVGNGIVKIGRNNLFCKNATVKGVAVLITDVRSGIPALCLNCVPDSYAILQNLPSILSCRSLNPLEGNNVLDMCAAPGNKTTHLAMIMNDTGSVIAIDRTIAKVQIIKNRCQQFGITCVKCFVYDSTKAVMKQSENEDEIMKSSIQTITSEEKNTEMECASSSVHTRDIMLGPPFPHRTFDRILLDAPCSAMGQRPRLIKNINLQQLNSYPPLQRKLFESAVALLKPGGHLVYSTCTVTVAENEHLVKWALNTFPCLDLVPVESSAGGPGLENVGLTEQQRQCVKRFGPPMSGLELFCDNYDYNQDTVGFFIAHFVNKCC